MLWFMLWHNMLGMEKHDRAWHERDMADETVEYAEARGFFNRWSELSDIVYTTTRARWSGHRDISFPFSSATLFILGALYMFPKYTLRWLFFRVAGLRVGSAQSVREVRNPRKEHKLDGIAKKYELDTEQFRLTVKKQLIYWPLLK